MRERIRKKLPEIKRDIKEFVSDERGMVSKDKILKASFVLGMTSLLISNSAVAQDTTHTNNLCTAAEPCHFSGQTLTGRHTHHGNHTHY
jgi:hypothetical protein